ncbi:hypothetical protein CRE_15659 [Caenorhabditis remanei]|uniref:F-box domain-containing protein n=1 Tax=Caenorhabditis remanei TaxID=31234 RepID=E3N863_CAERE|nr:hypothetical protein CRE_15659 [Caenorhabditis remanei]
MSDSLCNNPIAIRACILNDVLRRKSIEKSFGDLCKVIGYQRMSFADFKYWFDRFSGGNYELEDEKSAPSKVLEFSNLPVDVIDIIVKNLKLKEQLILRKVCKQLRDIVDDQKTFPLKYIEIGCADNYIFCQFDNKNVFYVDGTWEKPDPYYYSHFRDFKVIRSNDYVKTACTDLDFVLKNSNLHLDRFDFVYTRFINTRKGDEKQERAKQNFESVKSILKSMDRKLVVKQFELRDSELEVMLDILPFIKPGTLEYIEIFRSRNQMDWNVNGESYEIIKLVNMEQWKQATEVYCRYAFEYFQQEHFAHFKRVGFYEWSIYPRLLVAFRNLFLIPLSNITRCHVDTKDGFMLDDIDIEYYGRLVGQPAPPLDQYGITRHYDIPGTTDYLEFNLRDRMEDMTIKKKSRLTD